MTLESDFKFVLPGCGTDRTRLRQLTDPPPRSESSFVGVDNWFGRLCSPFDAFARIVLNNSGKAYAAKEHKSICSLLCVLCVLCGEIRVRFRSILLGLRFA